MDAQKGINPHVDEIVIRQCVNCSGACSVRDGTAKYASRKCRQTAREVRGVFQTCTGRRRLALILVLLVSHCRAGGCTPSRVSTKTLRARGSKVRIHGRDGHALACLWFWRDATCPLVAIPMRPATRSRSPGTASPGI